MEIKVNIHVGNLPGEATVEDLRTAFERFGQVTDITIITNKFTGKSKGFGFAKMPDETQANNAIRSLNGKELKGRRIIVNKARPRGWKR